MQCERRTRTAVACVCLVAMLQLAGCSEYQAKKPSCAGTPDESDSSDFGSGGPVAMPGEETGPTGEFGSPANDLASSGSGATAPSAARPSNAELAAKVDEIVRLTLEYNKLAASVQDRETYLRREAELKAMEEPLNRLGEDVMIAQAKMTPAEKADFDRQHYDTKAKPIIQERFGHARRFEGFFQ